MANWIVRLTIKITERFTIDPITPFALRKIGERSRARVLDVGCGDTIPATKYYRPSWQINGMDKKSGVDFVVDLDTTPRPDVGMYDIIIMRHVIEHLRFPLVVLCHFARRVKPGGAIYLEYPSERSLTLPSMEGTLNFYDDPTHIYLPETDQLHLILECMGFAVKSGRRRDWLRILLMPVHVPLKFVSRGFRFRGSDFWDILGFADYIYAEYDGGGQEPSRSGR